MAYTTQVPPVTAAIAAAQASLPAAGEITAGTATYAAALAAFGAALLALDTAENAATAALQPIMAGSLLTPTPLGATTVFQATQNLETALAAITDLATLGVMGAYLSRAMANLSNAGA